MPTLKFILNSHKIYYGKKTLDIIGTLLLTQEDQIIMNLVTQHGKKKWTLIADEMQKIMPRNSRTSKQIR